MAVKILALDLASTTGWAFGQLGHRCTSGSLRFAPKKALRPEIFVGAITWLTGKIKTERPDIVIFESPLPAAFMGGKTNLNSTRILFGLCAIVEGVSMSHNILKIADINVSTVRKSLLGTTPKGKDAKPAVLKYAQECGYNPKDDNEADALMLWIYFTRFLKGANYE